MDAVAMQELYLSFLSRLGNAFLSLLGLTAIFVSIFFQVRTNRLLTVLSELSSLPFEKAESIGNDIISKASQYARLYEPPHYARPIIISLFALGSLTCLSTWVLILHNVGLPLYVGLPPDVSLVSLSQLAPLVFATVFLGFLLIAMWQILSPSLRFFGIYLPKPDEIGALQVLERVTGANAQTLLNHAGLGISFGISAGPFVLEAKMSPGSLGTLYLFQRNIWLWGFSYLIIIRPSIQTPGLPPIVGVAPPARPQTAFSAGKFACLLPKAVETFKFTEPPELTSSTGVLYVYHSGQEHPLFSEFSFSKTDHGCSVEPKTLTLVLDGTCSLANTESLRARHPDFARYVGVLRRML